ncbi:hypothetical protein PACTADRAFT_51156 [Pachysolen tannophilus NRRL Y-2460]|uniref:Growth regulation protein n=1 Tax=Pachysolen tannophilus NRRL Y-2460 TaxID=669874 RepID=A0A1E4TRC6_PACTA|nr:hypothetical protein PACTADRAFT_51156 [Pachysolen tannophilus NRRL Y-2460]
MSFSPDSIVTQVSQDAPVYQGDLVNDESLNDDYNTEIKLNIRGVPFTITKDELMALPESILLCLFPNGVFVDVNGNIITNLTEDDVVYVNFPPDCFRYIVQTFSEATADLSPQPKNHYYDMNDTDVLHDKPSIIVLREDLDYYCIPPFHGISLDDMKQIKLRTGEYLNKNPQIFDGLGYKPGKTLGAAEQHLLDMLCSSGFSIDGKWGHRSMEPGKAVVSSLALVRLRADEPTPSSQTSPNLAPTSSISSSRDPLQHQNTNSSSNTNSNTNANNTNNTNNTRSRSRSRIATLANAAARSASRSASRLSKKKENTVATKLLLFWRKPARKCWWTNEEFEVEPLNLKLKDPSTGKYLEGGTKIKVHIRRVWTLELSVIGVQ